jgi:hypothetical protein
LGEESPAPKTITEQIFEIILIIAERWKMTPFQILNTDIDQFILLCNCLTNLGGETPPEKTLNEREESADFWAAL